MSQPEGPKLEYKRREPQPEAKRAKKVLRFGYWLSTPRPMVVYYAVTFALSIIAFALLILVRVII